MIGLTQDIKQCMRSAIVLISLLTTIFQFFTLLIFLRAVPCSVLVGSRHNRSKKIKRVKNWKIVVSNEINTIADLIHCLMSCVNPIMSSVYVHCIVTI